MTSVFLRLMVRPKDFAALDRWLARSWRSSSFSAARLSIGLLDFLFADDCAQAQKYQTRNMSSKQFGFVPDKGTRNAIFTLTMLMERCMEVQKDLHLCFIDYSKAFDKVKHEELFKLLENLDIDGKDLRVIRNLYWDQTAAVRIEGEYIVISKT